MIHIRDFVEPYRAAAPIGAKRRRDDRRISKDRFRPPLSQANLLKPVLFVPRSMPALDLLIRMQATRTHLALVIDEYGGTDGLVTIEDIMEMIVGDIEDEHDVVERAGHRANSTNGDFLVDARADLDEVTARLGVDFTPRRHAGRGDDARRPRRLARRPRARCAARSSRRRSRATNSRSSTPIRAAWASCGCGREGISSVTVPDWRPR